LEFDLVIRNGFVVDGSGAPRTRGDVAVVGGRIVVVGSADGTGREEIDADGLVVAPGFVDGHTHMDAQVFWDELGTSSCWHGVTSVVMGNCGFTLAPAREDARELVVRNLERAEDISARAIAEGVTWSWSTFAEYFDALDKLPKGLNYAGSIGHSALRTWAMGERAFEGPATDADLEVMKRELSHALHAGAAGFTTSRAATHLTSDDRPVASRVAPWSEVVALVNVVGRESDAVFQLAHGRPDPQHPELREDYYRRHGQLALSSGVPIVFGLFASTDSSPWLNVLEDTVARGGHMYGLTHCRGVGVLQSFQTQLCFDTLPAWQEIRNHPLDQQRRLLEDPDVRARLVQAAHHGDFRTTKGAGPPPADRPPPPDYEAMYIMHSPYLFANPTVADEARRRGVDPVDVVIDVALENDLKVFFHQVLIHQPEDELVKLLRNPNTAMTFSDAGAHVSQILDVSIQTHLLAYWVRQRQVFTLEEAIRMITHQPARIWRLHDRGMIAPGYAADLTILDPDTVAPLMPRVVNDLPGGARRLVQHAQGYVATIVNGQIFTRDGEAAEARAGSLLRAGRIPIPV
jgi:N-acyl-D-aspartate/D-glutamate deacylase